MTAAYELFKMGHDDVLILEALDRIGGRLCTEKHSDRFVDVGGQW